jgi:hypothetical protein
MPRKKKVEKKEELVMDEPTEETGVKVTKVESPEMDESVLYTKVTSEPEEEVEEKEEE